MFFGDLFLLEAANDLEEALIAVAPMVAQSAKYCVHATKVCLSMSNLIPRFNSRRPQNSASKWAQLSCNERHSNVQNGISKVQNGQR